MNANGANALRQTEIHIVESPTNDLKEWNTLSSLPVNFSSEYAIRKVQAN